MRVRLSVAALAASLFVIPASRWSSNEIPEFATARHPVRRNSSASRAIIRATVLAIGGGPARCPVVLLMHGSGPMRCLALPTRRAVRPLPRDRLERAGYMMSEGS